MDLKTALAGMGNQKRSVNAWIGLIVQLTGRNPGGGFPAFGWNDNDLATYLVSFDYFWSIYTAYYDLSGYSVLDTQTQTQSTTQSNTPTVVTNPTTNTTANTVVVSTTPANTTNTTNGTTATGSTAVVSQNGVISLLEESVYGIPVYVIGLGVIAAMFMFTGESKGRRF